MGNRNLFKKVLEHLADAQLMLKNGVEKGNLSTIERDILLEKLRASYEVLLFDKKGEDEPASSKQDLSSKNEKIQTERPKEIIVQNKEVEISKASPVIPQPEKANTEVITSNPKEVLVDIEVSDEIEKSVENEAKEEFRTGEEKITESDEDFEKPHSETLGEKYQGKKKFRNEVLGTGKKDVASVLQNKPIYDLTKAIGINDKFLFTKELFSGNAELYSKTIKKLNEFTDINDALIYIQDNFSWDDKNEAANQLIDLVRRKLLIG